MAKPKRRLPKNGEGGEYETWTSETYHVYVHSAVAPSCTPSSAFEILPIGPPARHTLPISRRTAGAGSARFDRDVIHRPTRKTTTFDGDGSGMCGRIEDAWKTDSVLCGLPVNANSDVGRSWSTAKESSSGHMRVMRRSRG